MRLSKESIKTRYNSYDARVQEFLYNVFDDIKKEHPDLNNYFLVMFDLLAQQLVIYFKSIDAINADDFIAGKDKYERSMKNPAITVMNSAHKEIVKILNEFSMSPFGLAKLRRVQKDDGDESAENLVASLIS